MFIASVDVVNNSSTTDSAADSKEKRLSQRNGEGFNESAKVRPAAEPAQSELLPLFIIPQTWS